MLIPRRAAFRAAALCALFGWRAGAQTWPEPKTVAAPSDAPALPAEMQVFDPGAAAGITPGAGAPQVAEWTRAAGPDETIVVSGWQVSSHAGTEHGRDVRFRFFGQTTAGDAVRDDGSIQQLDGDRALVTLPGTLPADAAYLFWICSDGGTSYPERVNMSDAWWAGPEAATRGDTVYVFGRDLLLPDHTNAWVYLQPSGGGGQWVPTAAGSNAYRLAFEVPGGLANGTYELWTHNGGGGAYGWSGPLELTVNDGYPWSGATYNVKTYGALGNGTADDTAAIKSALNAANAAAWSTVYFPAGTYLVSEEIDVGNELRLLGDSRETSVLRAVDGFNAQFMIDVNGDSVEMTRLGLEANALNKVRMDTVVWLRGNDDIRIVDCRWDTRGSSPADAHLCRRILFRNVETYQSSSFFFGNSGQIFFEGCHFYGFGGHCNSLFGGFGAHELSISGCTADHYGVLVGDPDPDNPGEPVHFYKGRFIADQPHWATSRRHYFGENRLNNACPPLFQSHEWRIEPDAGASGGAGLYGWGNLGEAYDRPGARTWIAASTDLPQTLTVDLGSAESIDETQIAFNKYANRTLTYQVDVSTDNSTWTPVVASKDSNRVLWNVDTFAPVSARYVRVRITGISYSEAVGITEVEVYESGTHRRLEAAGVSASSNDGTAIRAIDAPGTIRDWDARATFAAQFVKTGTHYVWVRGRGTLLDGQVAAKAMGSDSCHVGLDGSTPDGADYINNIADTSNPAAYVWRNMTDDVDAGGSALRATLAIPSAGGHDVDLYIFEDGFRCDKILLTVNPSYTPSGEGPAETVVGDTFTQENTSDGLLVMEAENAGSFREGNRFILGIDQNSGEQIMWESNARIGVGEVVSAGAATVTLAGDLTDDASRMIVVVDGKGLGQSRDLSQAQVVPLGGGLTNTIVTVSEPWNVVPDTSSKVALMRAVRRAVVYGNTCDATDRCWTGTQHVASAGVQTYKGGADVIVADNLFQELRDGVSLWVTDPLGSKPVTSWLITGNTFRKCRSGIRFGNGLNSAYPNSIFADVFRRNVFDTTYAAATGRALTLAWTAHPHPAYDADMLVFEHNQLSNVAGGVGFDAATAVSGAMGSALFYKNDFALGTAAFTGSYVFETSTVLSGVLPLLRQNTLSGFATDYRPAIVNAPVPTAPRRVTDAAALEGGAAAGSLALWNAGTAAMAWTATVQPGSSWLALDTASGTVPDQQGAADLAFSVDAGSLAPGEYEAVVLLEAASAPGGAQAVTLRLAVGADADRDGTGDGEDPDDDNDTMPDTWELAHAFDPYEAADGTGDADGDGSINADEYRSGTGPRDGASVLKAKISRGAGHEVLVSFDALQAVGAGYEGLERRYDLDRCPELPGGDWAGLPACSNVLGQGSTIVYTNVPSGAKAFFRVRARLE